MNSSFNPTTNQKSGIIIPLPAGKQEISLSPQLATTANVLIKNQSLKKMGNEINPVVDNTEHASQKYNTTLESDYFEKNQCCRACNNWQPISHFKLKKKDYICNHCRYTLYEKSIRRLLFSIYRNHTRWASGGIHYSRDQFMKCVYNHEDFHKAYCEWIYTDFSCALRPRYLKIDYRKPFKLDNLYLENIYDSEDKSKTFDPLMINFVKGFIK